MEMVEYALYYCKLGYSVIPIDPKSKKPICKFADKPKFTENQIRALWRDNPSANIALKTDDFFVIDIDVHNGVDGYKSLKNWEHVNLIPKTLVATTASGGKHIFLKKRQDITLGQQIGFLEGCDLKANNNNYVLVAPSRTKKGVYSWDKEKSTDDGSMTEAPYELVEELKKMQTHEFTYEFKTFSQGKREPNKTTALFEKIIYGLGDEGGRNDSLAKFVAGLLYRQVGLEAVYELAHITNANTKNPLSESEVNKTVQSMIDKDMRGGNS